MQSKRVIQCQRLIQQRTPPSTGLRILSRSVPLRSLNGSLMPVRFVNVDALRDGDDSKCDRRARPQPVKVPMQAKRGAERYGDANL